MRKIVQISGGKDSSAIAILLWSQGVEFTAVFCDTGNEAKETYEYLEYLETALNIKITRLYPELGFYDLARKKKRFPSLNARFCTSELKIKPFVDWLLAQSGEFKIYQGIRKDESRARSKLNVFADYFGLEKGAYRIKDTRAWLKAGNTAFVFRPIFELTADEVFIIHKKHNIKPNPLYKKGFKRVGCFPCVFCNQGEIKRISLSYPEIIEKIAQMEIEIGRTFCGPNYIPSKKIASIKEVVKHITKPDQIKMFELDESTCTSIYNICE